MGDYGKDWHERTFHAPDYLQGDILRGHDLISPFRTCKAKITRERQNGSKNFDIERNALFSSPVM